MSLFLSKSRQWISLIRLMPFNTDTPEGRSKERLRRVALTALVSAFAQGISMLTLLISIPLTLNYLGAERYGLWITISSLIAVLGFADLGMGNGLLNAVAEANGRNDQKAAESYVSSAFYILTGIALFLGVIWLMVYPHVSWSWLFNVITPKAMAEAGPATSIFIWCMLINLPIGLIQKIYDGYQEGYINGLWRAGGAPPDWLEGNLLPGFGGEDLVVRPVFAMEAKKNPSRSPLTQATLAMLQGDYKLIWYVGYPGYDNVYELYNLATDPEELLDLSKSHPDVLLSMGKELKTRLAEADQPYAVKV
jgi:hypothetical protein